MTGELDFAERIVEVDPAAGVAGAVETLVLNVGRRCEIACGHCHHRCSPDAAEAMSASTMERALSLARSLGVELVDVTGGSPELWPHLPDLLARAHAAGIDVRVRSNLVALSEDRSRSLAELMARTRTAVLASVPAAGLDSDSQWRPDHARGRAALRRLVELGYGTERGPRLEFAVNPESGLPEAESTIADGLELSMAQLGITRFRVRSIANAPLGRFADRLAAGGGRREYLSTLVGAFDPMSVGSLPCRRGVTVAWDGRLYDCDFNLSAGLPLADSPSTLAQALAQPERLAGRRISFGAHCFSCTIGAGSG